MTVADLTPIQLYSIVVSGVIMALLAVWAVNQASKEPDTGPRIVLWGAAIGIAGSAFAVSIMATAPQ